MKTVMHCGRHGCPRESHIGSHKTVKHRNLGNFPSDQSREIPDINKQQRDQSSMYVNLQAVLFVSFDYFSVDGPS